MLGTPLSCKKHYIYLGLKCHNKCWTMIYSVGIDNSRLIFYVSLVYWVPQNLIWNLWYAGSKQYLKPWYLCSSARIKKHWRQWSKSAIPLPVQINNNRKEEKIRKRGQWKQLKKYDEENVKTPSIVEFFFLLMS